MKLPTDEQLQSVTNKKTVPPGETLLHNGGLQNMAQLLAQGYTIAAYVMNSKTRAEIDAWIAAHPDRNAPFSAAPTEIDESVEAIMVRLEESTIDVEDNDQVLAKMKALVEPLPKPKTGDVSKATGEVYGNQ